MHVDVVTFATSKSRRLTLSRSQMASARKVKTRSWSICIPYLRAPPADHFGVMAAWTAQGRLWHAALNAERLRVAEDGPQFVNCSYQKLAERAKTAKTQEHLIVEKDINRTFPERPAFQTEAARNRLRRVLGAYALRNTYCQGMSYVAALMLQHLPCLLYTSPSPRDRQKSRMPSSA